MDPGPANIFFFSLARWGEEEVDVCGGVADELREEVEGEGDGARKGEVGRLLTLGEQIASLGEAGTEGDLVLSMPPSALPRPEWL